MAFRDFKFYLSIVLGVIKMNDNFLTFLGNTMNEDGKQEIMNYIKSFENLGKDIKNKEDKLEFNDRIDEIIEKYGK